MSKMFGPTQILKGVVTPIKQEDVRNYYEAKKKIVRYRATGLCSNEQEQKELLDYQRKINRIEFRYIVEYSEIINDLLGQLINWSFLRERDLMYFQLGFHYMCLHNEKAIKPEMYRVMSTADGKEVKNAILHQVGAMYINGICMGEIEGSHVKFEKGNIATSGKIGMFLSWSEQILEGSEIQVKKPSEAIYNAGLEVFENINEHDNITEIRNFIDHFKYYAVQADESAKKGQPKNILDLYSEVFDRFFTYDMKYQKNVPNMLGNILERYFIILYPEFGSGEKKVGVGNNAVTKDRAQINVKKLSSDMLTYKFHGGSLKIDAQDQEYKETVARILYNQSRKNGLESAMVQEAHSSVSMDEKKKEGNKGQNKGQNKGKNNGQNKGKGKGGNKRRNKGQNSGLFSVKSRSATEKEGYCSLRSQ